MDKKFLLTYGFENTEGMDQTSYRWYKTEEDMRKNIEDMKEYMKDFSIVQAIEILSSRFIKL
jgi:hypothetical protein